MAGLGRDVAPFAAACPNQFDPPGLVIVPGDESDLAAVVRPGRVAFEVRPAGQPPRRAAGGVLDPQMAERFIDDSAAVGAGLGEADHLHVEAVGRDLLLLAHRVLDETSAGDVERDGADRRPRCGVDAVQSAARPKDDRAIVGGPADPGIDPMDRPGFLHVAVENVGQLGHPPGGDVHQHQGRFVRMRRMKAKLLPSGEGVGRIAPPGPVT